MRFLTTRRESEFQVFDPEVHSRINELLISNSSKSTLHTSMSQADINNQLRAIKGCIVDEERDGNPDGVLELHDFLYTMMCDNGSFADDEVAALYEYIGKLARQQDRRVREALKLASSTPVSGIATVIELRRAPQPVFGGRRKHRQW